MIYALYITLCAAANPCDADPRILEVVDWSPTPAYTCQDELRNTDKLIRSKVPKLLFNLQCKEYLPWTN